MAQPELLVRSLLFGHKDAFVTYSRRAEQYVNSIVYLLCMSTIFSFYVLQMYYVVYTTGRIGNCECVVY